MKRKTSHALIGKYVYLHYLRDRDILSTKKLAKFGVDRSSVFGHKATIDGLQAVVEHLDEWLNGSVFPLQFSGKNAPTEKHLRCVAGVFSGDEVSEIGDRQLSLDFEAYDFSHIPIETLSVVYEQFLHAPDKPNKSNKSSRGRKLRAYYTPIPVVNLMLAELEERRPLKKGMRVFDPSCGSGAFLVQCYRRLIEKEFPPGSSPKPGQLRELLQRSIYGIDVEVDACNVTELSLILTLLDYVDPPDLESRGRTQFRLPVLRDNNIFCANFFENPSNEHPPLQEGFDWIVGNPPWKRLNPDKLDKHDRPAWKWIKANEKERPVGGNQVARAFAWEVLKYAADDGEIALFLPAMTLFENPARGFRQAFFQQAKVNTVVNFSNLAEVISAKRFRVPAAAFFYELRSDGAAGLDDDEFVRTYSPMVANQEPTRPIKQGVRNETWSIVINASEVRDIPTIRVADGNGLPWKLAMWGSSLDLRLLAKLERRFDLISKLERDDVIDIAEGPALEAEHVPEGDGKNIWVEEVVGKKVLDSTQLKRMRRIFVFPNSALKENRKFYASVRRGYRGLVVCRPPHVIVSAARNFAVYSDQYLIVPPRQIGIASPAEDKDFLKALSLYISSDFVYYHQFFTSTEFGVKRDRATLEALRRLPVGIAALSPAKLRAWSKLHSQLTQTTPRRLSRKKEVAPGRDRQTTFLPPDNANDELERLLAELNEMVSESLNLETSERALIHDLVQVRLALNDGKTGERAIRAPKEPELETYARRLKSELDDFIDGELPKRHDVCVVYDQWSGMIQINLVRQSAMPHKVTVIKADAAGAKQLEKTRQRLRVERAQWIYFDRNLRIYEGTRTYIFKPMQRFHWTESQAMIDAREIIAETLQGVES
ncbi:MAG: N-6 DNA methylase [Planctomycetes bacterium]|nr:N-6 DNA methylase [Planctomycetota bacterium]